MTPQPMLFPLLPGPCFSKYSWQSRSISVPWRLPKMQKLGPTPGLLIQILHFNKIPVDSGAH